MLKQLSEKEEQLITLFFNPKCFAETLFTEGSPDSWLTGGETINVRLYQIPFLQHDSVLVDDNRLSKQENFDRRKMAGEILLICGRNTGKTFCGLGINIAAKLIQTIKKQITCGAYDLKHLKLYLEPLCTLFSSHPFFKKFKKGMKRGNPDYSIECKNGTEMASVNTNVKGKDQGNSHEGRHSHYYYEDECFDFKTPIIAKKNGKIEKEMLGTVVNDEQFSEVLVYDFELKNYRFSKILRRIKKEEKDSEVYELRLENTCLGKKEKVLICSKNQEFYTSKGWKKITELTNSDYIKTLEPLALSHTQKQVLVGTLLGDTSIDRGVCANSRIHLVHATKQKEYLNYKKEIFNEFFINNIDFTKKSISKDYLTEFKGTTCHVNSSSSGAFNEFINFKKDVENFKSLLNQYMTEISLAFWYMDDGNRGTSNINLHTSGFSNEYNKILVDLIKTKFNIEASIKISKSKYNYLYFDKINSVKFINLIKPYIFPIMKYKIIPQWDIMRAVCENKLDELLNYTDLTSKTISLGELKVLTITKRINHKKTYYDLTTETGNFFANRILVHNCQNATEKSDAPRIDAVSELGCVDFLCGITNTVKNSPLGKKLNNKEYADKHWVRVPQYVNKNFTEEKRIKRIKDYAGENTIGFKTNVEAIMVEGAQGAFDMGKVRACTTDKKTIKLFEITPENYNDFERILIIEPLKNASKTFIHVDVGDSTNTEICITYKIGKKYFYTYRITTFKLSLTKQLPNLLKWIFDKVKGNYMGLDSTTMGKAVWERMVDLIPPIDKNGKKIDRVIWCSFSQNMLVGFEKDEDGNIKRDEKGNPIEKYENTIVFTVQKLKELFFDTLFVIPEDDYTFDEQFSNYFEVISGNRIKYEPAGPCHIVQAFEVLAKMIWDTEFLAEENPNQETESQEVVGFFGLNKKEKS